jgi:nickel-dependent lactate racemase
MQVRVPWSTGTVPVEIDESRVAGVLGANVERAADPEAVLRQALAASDGSLKKFLAGAASPLLVVVNDATRPTPTAEVLRVIRTDLEE